ncbi:MAG: threonine/serine exporter family protein, partial [Psychrobacter sp.]
MTSISYVKQQRITRLCVRCGLLLMQYGAESAVVVDLSKRLGLALGMNSVECSLNFNAITLTTICDERCITTTRD